MLYNVNQMSNYNSCLALYSITNVLFLGDSPILTRGDGGSDRQTQSHTRLRAYGDDVKRLRAQTVQADLRARLERHDVLHLDRVPDTGSGATGRRQDNKEIDERGVGVCDAE